MPAEVINISGGRQHNLRKLHLKRFTSARMERRSKSISAINGPAAAGKVAKPFEGLVPQMQRLYELTKSEFTRNRIRSFMTYEPCKVCNGARLKPEILDPP
jgi:excinuclease UvrABC ATPase subunit